MSRLERTRVALWHLRRGGVDQLRRHLRRAQVHKRTPGLDGEVRDKDGNLTFAPWPLPERPPRRDLRVAVILDDFSRLAFGYEWEQVAVKPSTWREELTAEPVDLLFVESAWHGNRDAWQYHLTGTSAPRPAFVELVEWCREQGIPTVFWNKEDPAHYTDFLDSARLFDHVFTTDVNRLDDYRRDLGHEKVGVLPFAAQPAIHNPIRPARGHQARDIAFGGMYFAHKYPERREQMDLLLGAANDVSGRMERGLEIFSRYLGADANYQFPAPLDERVVGSLDYRRMLSAYRAYKVFLNVNSVVDSPSMCARRVFEISASGTPVISTPSSALTEYFPDDEVIQVADRHQASMLMRGLVRNSDLRSRIVHRAQRRIWRHHTYARRVDVVLDAARLSREMDPSRAGNEITALVSSNRPGQLAHVISTLGRQVNVRVQLAYLAHGWDVDEAEVYRVAREAGIEDTVVLRADSGVPLGECLNRLLDVADADVAAKIDDDDFYASNYLEDQYYALAYSHADLVGKHAHFVRLEGMGITVFRFPDQEHRYTDFVMGPTIVARTHAMKSVKFPRLRSGEDTGFLRNLVAQGGTVYSADRYNFVQVRRPSPGNHTWRASDAELIATGSAVEFADGTYGIATV